MRCPLISALMLFPVALLQMQNTPRRTAWHWPRTGKRVVKPQGGSFPGGVMAGVTDLITSGPGTGRVQLKLVTTCSTGSWQGTPS